MFPSSPKTWGNQNSRGQAVVYHFDDVATSSKLSTVYPNASISSGYSVWTALASGKIRVVNHSGGSTGSLGTITHMVPTESYWRLIFGAAAYNYVGLTEPYDTNGTKITVDNATSTTSYIRSATIYYRPNSFGTLNIYTADEFTALIAHEIGHALGFGHVSDTSSIMHVNHMVTSLNSYDLTCLATKYPVS